MDDWLIENNWAEYRAGGVVVNYRSNVPCSNVRFVGNKTNGCGGAVWTDDQASQYEQKPEPLFSGCTFTGNKADYDGGAVANYDGGWTKLDELHLLGECGPHRWPTFPTPSGPASSLRQTTSVWSVSAPTGTSETVPTPPPPSTP